MKKIYLAFILSLFSILSNAQVTSGLVAHWPFNGNALDYAGTHHGNMNNITFTTGRSGGVNTAAYFKGNNTSFISTPFKSDLNISKMSMMAIVKPEAFYTDLCQASTILCRGNQYTNGFYHLVLYNNAYDSSCTVTGDTNYYTFTPLVGNKLVYQTKLQYTPVTRTNSWYCVIATWDDTTYRTYVNGVLMFAVKPFSNPPIGTSTDSLTIGGNRHGNYSLYPYWFKGAMDEVRLYNRALTAAEIDTLCGVLYIASNNPKVFCPDESFNLNYTTTTPHGAGNVFSVQLSDASGSFASPTVIGTLTSTISGSIPCTMSASPGTGYKIRVISTVPAKVSDEMSITVNNTIPPTVTITASPSTGVGKGALVTYTATALNAGSTPTYQWYKNSTAISGATASVYSAIAGIDFMSGDNINVTVKSGNKCSNPDTAKSNAISMDLKMGIDKYEAADIFYSYPNPNKGTFTLKGKTAATNSIAVQIVNTIGQIVYTGNADVRRGEVNQTISLNNVIPGIYYVRLYCDGSVQTIKTIIQ